MFKKAKYNENAIEKKKKIQKNTLILKHENKNCFIKILLLIL